MQPQSLLATDPLAKPPFKQVGHGTTPPQVEPSYPRAHLQPQLLPATDPLAEPPFKQVGHGTTLAHVEPSYPRAHLQPQLLLETDPLTEPPFKQVGHGTTLPQVDPSYPRAHLQPQLLLEADPVMEPPFKQEGHGMTLLGTTKLYEECFPLNLAFQTAFAPPESRERLMLAPIIRCRQHWQSHVLKFLTLILRIFTPSASVKLMVSNGFGSESVVWHDVPSSRSIHCPPFRATPVLGS